MRLRMLCTGLLRPFRPAVTLVALGVMAVLVLGSPLGPGLVRAVRQAFAHAATRITTVITPGPVLVERLQALNRLETARMVSRQVVEARAERANLPSVFGKDRLLFVAQTEAIAGVDLSSLSAKDVRVRGNAVTLSLPAPQLFSVRIDDDNSKVYARERGLLVFSPDPQLERQARLQALDDARRTLGPEAMGAARTNAETNLRQLLGAMGYEDVQIRWTDRSV